MTEEKVKIEAEAVSAPLAGGLTAYCLKCKTSRTAGSGRAVFMANGRPAAEAQCPECGTRLFKIGATPEHATLPKPAVAPQTKAKAKIEPEPEVKAEAVSAPLAGGLTAYCLKCKTTRTAGSGRAVFMANGRPAAEAQCPECGTRLFKIGATPEHATLPKPAVAPQTKAKARAKAEGKGEAKGKRGAASDGASGRKPKTRGEPGQDSRTTGGPRRGEYAARPLHPGDQLVIVESPAKARTVGRFLGRGYDVRASVGHVRDLLRSQLSVDIENGFAPKYRVPDDKRDVVKGLKAAAAAASTVYLATDPDREGEAIAWHLLEAAEIDPQRAHRVVFHEITKNAIAEAFSHSRDVDMRLVDAQQARRILDRLVGYQISPLLWDRVKSRLSAGRVQSVALRLVVEREREILAFAPVEYWSLDAELAPQTSAGQASRPTFLARLVRVQGADADLRSRTDAAAIVTALQGAVYEVASVRRGERRRRPYPPFTTSTLQQDAAAKLGLTAARTMRIAQDLYEGIDIGEGGAVGLITYMRTDSVNVAAEAQAEARGLIADLYGPESAPAEPNIFKSRAKNAQEAHEAIRPTSVRRLPAELRDKLTAEQARLYELIWQRFVASQMAAAIYDTVSVDVLAGAPGSAERPYLFRASGSSVRFPGFLAVYAGGAVGPGENGKAAEPGDDKRGATGPGERPQESDGGESGSGQTVNPILAELSAGQWLDLIKLLPEQHFTQPPPRYTEASLVKTLEENGIGRPSTYAAIISTIIDRGYVVRAEKKLAPTELGFTVNDLLVKHFDSIFSVGFTATMEEHLDSISRGDETMQPVLTEFYGLFGPQLQDAERTMEKVALEPQKTGETCPECGSELVIKQGRFGRFVGCSNYPTCRFTQPLMTRLGVKCPKDGGELVERRTRKGRTFYGCANYPACDFTSWKRPISQPCDACGGLVVVASKDWAECTVCGKRTKATN